MLLLFVGAFGLVAFAFGGVQPSLRPVAEVTIAAVPFLTAALLLRRGAEIVGRSLELAGGLLLPVMVMTVFLDDVPPDLDGGPMVVVMTLALLGLGEGDIVPLKVERLSRANKSYIIRALHAVSPVAAEHNPGVLHSAYRFVRVFGEARPRQAPRAGPNGNNS